MKSGREFRRGLSQSGAKGKWQMKSYLIMASKQPTAEWAPWSQAE